MNGNQPQMLPAPRSKTWFWAILIVGALVVLGLAYYLYTGFTPTPAGEVGGEEAVAIEEDLQTVDLGGLDSELSDIEKELGQ